MERGALIVFEGLDQSGKKYLSQYADFVFNQGDWVAVDRLSFPRLYWGLDGYNLRKYLYGMVDLSPEEAYKLFSKQRHEVTDWIKALLADNTYVVIDRFYHSGIAYGMANGLDRKWCVEQELGLPKPDAVIYLDITPEESVKRSQYRARRYDTIEFQTGVKKAYEELVDNTWHRIDATGDWKTTESQMLDITHEIVREFKRKPRPLEVLTVDHFNELKRDV